MQSKQQLRQQLRAQRAQLSPADIQRASHELVQQLQPLLTPGQTIAIYDASGGEISLDPLFDLAKQQQLQLVRPIAFRNTQELKFERVTQREPQPIFHSAEYELVAEVKWYNLDLVLVPLLAADKHGYRLGQGGGYYDVTFKSRQKLPILCGVGYDWQLMPEIPHEPWDVRLDYFASNKHLIAFK
jgi:5-formyltetrahydrofolate cyclo-ligase